MPRPTGDEALATFTVLYSLQICSILLAETLRPFQDKSGNRKAAYSGNIETTLLAEQRQKKKIDEKLSREKVCEGAYRLHGTPGNSSWKIKWYASFHLEYY